MSNSFPDRSSTPWPLSSRYSAAPGAEGQGHPRTPHTAPHVPSGLLHAPGPQPPLAPACIVGMPRRTRAVVAGSASRESYSPGTPSGLGKQWCLIPTIQQRPRICSLMAMFLKFIYDNQEVYLSRIFFFRFFFFTLARGCTSCPPHPWWVPSPVVSLTCWCPALVSLAPPALGCSCPCLC